MEIKQDENETLIHLDDLTKISELNSLAVENLFEEKIEAAIEILKKCEILLETLVMENDKNFDKKVIIIILHNLACCYQKMKDFESCISYLEAVLYHFDGKLESKYNIKITPQGDFKLDDSKINLGDYILELRFSSKFHLQMCAVLSQANQHKEALHHARLAAAICEDNIIKTYHLFKSKVNVIHNSFFEERLKEVENVIGLLYKKVINDKKLSTNPNGNGYQLREKDINELLKKEESKISIRNILGVKKKDDWIHMLNIGNIMFLSPLTNEDLDLDSDPKFELMRDAILEKIIMLTVSYFCMATELRFNTEASSVSNGDMWHSKAVEYSCMFLPGGCPIVKHYISSYYKHYANDLPVIPENEILENKIEILRGDVEEDDDTVIFAKLQPVDKLNFAERTNTPKITGPGFKLNLNKLNQESTLPKSYSSRDVIKKSSSLNKIPVKESLTDRSEKEDKSVREEVFKSLTSRDEKETLDKLLWVNEKKQTFDLSKTKKDFRPSFNTFYGRKSLKVVPRKDEKFKIYKQSSTPFKPKSSKEGESSNTKNFLYLKIDPVEIKYSLSPRIRNMFTDLSKKNDEERLNSSYGKKLKDNQLRLNSPVSTLSQMKNIPKIDTMFNRTKNFSLKESKADRVMAKNFKF